VKHFVTENYQRAREILAEHKDRLVQLADALLTHEVLDASQVRRLAAGLPLDEPATAAARVAVADSDEVRQRPKERTPIVPALAKPVTQE
jgi:cell division protease FtsH